MSAELTAQKVGAFGESAVEAELLRWGWPPANVNPTVKNAADYDIVAYRSPTEICFLRVKACGPNQSGFQFGGLKEVETSGFAKNDFTILVRMGRNRSADQFYVVPTSVVRKQLNEHKSTYLGTRRKDGQPRQNLGHWTLHLADLKSGEERPSHGLEKRWALYLENWSLLEGDTKSND